MDETPQEPRTAHWQQKRAREAAQQREAAQAILNTYTPPEYDVCELDTLRIDDRYQRARTESKVNTLRAHFHPNACQPLAVSLRADGSRYLVDGQHRRAVLTDIGLKSWPCLVYRQLSRVQEAAMWSELNTHQTKPQTSERFKAALVRKDPEALAIAAIVAEHGYSLVLARRRGGRGPGPINGQIDAIEALERIYRQGNAPALRDVLSLITRAWPDPAETSRTQRVVLMGLFLLLSGAWKPRLQLDHLVRVVSKWTPTNWIAKSRGITSGASTAEVLCEKIRTAYNASLRKKDRL
jgi:hypothetical protein